MNLHDIIPTTRIQTTKIAKSDLLEHNKSSEFIKEFINKISKNKQLLQIDGADTIIKSIVNEHNTHTSNIVLNHFKNKKVLPDYCDLTRFDYSMYETWSDRNIKCIDKQVNINNHMKMLSKLPKSKLTELINVSVDLHMIIVPYDYINKGHKKTETNTVNRHITSFLQSCEKNNLVPYVLCPLQYYDIIEHVSSENPNKSIICNDYQTIFDSVQMVLPALLMFSDNIKIIQENINDINKSINTIDNNMKNIINSITTMQSNMKRLEQKVDNHIKEQLEEKIKLEAITNELKQFKEQKSSLLMEDPLLFAIDESVDVLNPNTNDIAIIGPCWGAEMDEILAELYNKKIVKKQRSKIEGVFKEFNQR